MVAGVVKNMTGESAERAALGAGAIVMDILASNDKRQYHEKVKRIRELRPDMLLLSGGVDGGTKSHVVEIAEIVQSANPKPRLGINYKLPIIIAGNKDARSAIKNRYCYLTKSHNLSRSSLEYKNPVGFPGLQIKIALVFGVINFSKSSIGGSANPFSIDVEIGLTVIPEDVEKPL